jgi:hypothetical protein
MVMMVSVGPLSATHRGTAMFVFMAEVDGEWSLYSECDGPV